VSAGGSTDSLTATCPAANPNVVGGGYSGVGSPGLNIIRAMASYPSAGNAWTVTLTGDDNSWSAYAVCSK